MACQVSDYCTSTEYVTFASFEVVERVLKRCLWQVAKIFLPPEVFSTIPELRSAQEYQRLS